jgi:PEP-CTERM motif
VADENSDASALNSSTQEQDMVVRFLTTKVLPAVSVGAVALTVYCTTASGFFPPIPIASDTVITPPTVSPIVPVIPVPPPPVVPPPVVPPPFDPPKVVIPPVCPPPPPPHHCQVPEPATIAVGLIGLGAMGAAALRKKFGKPNADTRAS